MKTMTFSPQKTIKQLSLLLLSGLLLVNCSAEKQLTKASQFRFSYDDQSYRIRSISALDNGNSYNQLISSKFVATDFDKDRVLDKVVLGEAELAEVQKIYEYGLGILAEEDKVHIYSVDVVDYVKINSEFDYQIKSFHPQGSQPFNEFKVIRKHELTDRDIVLIDQGADGTLDEILKGPVQDVKDYQGHYTYVINSGLEKQRLVKKDDTILVKVK